MGKLHLKKMKKDTILISESNDPVITWLDFNNFSIFFVNLIKVCYQYLSLSFLFTCTSIWAIKLISWKPDCTGLLCKYLYMQRTREAHILIINIPLYTIKPCLSVPHGSRTDLCQSFGDFPFPIFVWLNQLQPFLCASQRTRHSEIHLALSCAAQAHRSEPNSDLKRWETAVNPVQVWSMGKPRYPHSNKLSLVITLLEQQELQLGKNLLYYQNHSSAQTEIAAVGQNIILTTWSRTFVYFCSSISSISSAANNQPMGLTS